MFFLYYNLKKPKVYGRVFVFISVHHFKPLLANILWVKPILSFLLPNIPSSFSSAQVEKWHNQL